MNYSCGSWAQGNGSWIISVCVCVCVCVRACVRFFWILNMYTLAMCVCFLHWGYFVVSSLYLGINLSWFVSDFVYQTNKCCLSEIPFILVRVKLISVSKVPKSHALTIKMTWREDSKYPKLLMCLFVFTRLVCNLFSLTLPHMFVSVRLIVWVTHEVQYM